MGFGTIQVVQRAVIHRVKTWFKPFAAVLPNQSRSIFARFLPIVLVYLLAIPFGHTMALRLLLRLLEPIGGIFSQNSLPQRLLALPWNSSRMP